ncbi:hypothetical protein HMPREF0185_02888 [Brevundimonas diminuta 470-4]|nr:hypothetical protein HMPREF0185_02888 [Brevundimonas diminuta 470-4]
MASLSAGALTLLLAGGVLVILIAAVFGGRLSVDMRRRMELALALVFYPGAASLLLWRAATQDDRLLVVGTLIFAGLVVWNGVRIVRARLRRADNIEAAS